MITAICIDCGCQFQKKKEATAKKRCDECQRKNRNRRIQEYRKDIRAAQFLPKKKDLGCMKSYDLNMRLNEIAQAMGVSRERVRQLEHRALGKLKINFPELEEYMT